MEATKNWYITGNHKKFLVYTRWKFILVFEMNPFYSFLKAILSYMPNMEKENSSYNAQFNEFGNVDTHAQI